MAPVSRKLREMGGEVSLRMAVRKAGPVVTDLGNLLLDVTFRAFFRAAEDGRRVETNPRRPGRRAFHEEDAPAARGAP